MVFQTELFTGPEVQSFDLPDAKIDYWPRFFSTSEANLLLQSLIDQIPWKQNKIRFYGKESLVPRLESWHGEPGIRYALFRNRKWRQNHGLKNCSK